MSCGRLLGRVLIKRRLSEGLDERNEHPELEDWETLPLSMRFTKERKKM
jgi:hypothetical protein